MNIESLTVNQFLACGTPKEWVEEALKQEALLLIDHAHCEKKAAAAALHLIHCYPNQDALLQKMSRLAREELLHFQKVLNLMKKRNIGFRALPPSRYAQKLREEVRTSEPGRLIDLLLIGALIEARSCERFHALLPFLDQELKDFYGTLYLAEQRHFQDYLMLAKNVSSEETQSRLPKLLALEAELIQSKDDRFRFHSGIIN